jgi:hypothetical protein
MEPGVISLGSCRQIHYSRSAFSSWWLAFVPTCSVRRRSMTLPCHLRDQPSLATLTLYSKLNMYPLLISEIWFRIYLPTQCFFGVDLASYIKRQLACQYGTILDYIQAANSRRLRLLINHDRGERASFRLGTNKVGPSAAPCSVG